MHVNNSIAKIDKLIPEYEDYENKTPMIIANIYHKTTKENGSETEKERIVSNRN